MESSVCGLWPDEGIPMIVLRLPLLAEIESQRVY